MTRRESLVLMLQSLLLALFPWLRTERGLVAVGAAVEEMVPEVIDLGYGWWVESAKLHMLRSYNLQWRADHLGRAKEVA